MYVILSNYINASSAKRLCGKLVYCGVVMWHHSEFNLTDCFIERARTALVREKIAFTDHTHYYAIGLKMVMGETLQWKNFCLQCHVFG